MCFFMDPLSARDAKLPDCASTRHSKSHALLVQPGGCVSFVSFAANLIAYLAVWVTNSAREDSDLLRLLPHCGRSAFTLWQHPRCYAIATSEISWQAPLRPLRTVIRMRT